MSKLADELKKSLKEALDHAGGEEQACIEHVVIAPRDIGKKFDAETGRDGGRQSVH